MLRDLAAQHDTNASVIVESALRRFAGLPEQDQRRAVVETQASKRSLTSSGWRSVFWTALAEEFGTEDFDRGSGDHVMVLRSHGGFNVNFLLSDIRNSNPDALIIHIWQAGYQTHFVGTTAEYQLDDSVYEAARKTAEWIRAHASVVAEPSALTSFDELIMEVEARLSSADPPNATRALKPAKAPNEVSFVLDGRRVEVAMDRSGNVEIRRVDKSRIPVQGSHRTLPIGERAIDEILGGLRWLETRADA
jgi:hypothetical protein